MRFSQRIGKTPIKSIFQLDNIDEDLKNRLWNIIYGSIKKRTYYSSIDDSPRAKFFYTLWQDFLNRPLNEIPKTYITVDDALAQQSIREWYLEAEWYEVYDLVEFMLIQAEYHRKEELTRQFNEVLRLEVSGYRIIEGLVVKITSELEIETIEQAINSTDKLKPVNTHLNAALEMLSSRTSPDYRNAIKESISAVEAYCKLIANDPKASLGKALAIIEEKHRLHPSLKTAFTGLYAYASDAGGIRHALLQDDLELSFEDAKFMLVSCSSFVNYLSVKMNP